MTSFLTSHLKLPDIVVLTLFLSALLFIAFMLYDCHRSGLLHPLPSPFRGLEKRALNSLPKLIFTSASASDHKLEECAICLSQFEEGEEIRVLPQCGHSYHVVCIDTWLASHSTCPSCRQNLSVSVSDTCRKCEQSSSDQPPEVSIEV